MVETIMSHLKGPECSSTIMVRVFSHRHANSSREWKIMRKILLANKDFKEFEFWKETTFHFCLFVFFSFEYILNIIAIKNQKEALMALMLQNM